MVRCEDCRHYSRYYCRELCIMVDPLKRACIQQGKKRMKLSFSKEGTDLIRAVLPQPLLLEYDPEKTSKVNAWLSIFNGFENVWKYFDYEVLLDWDIIVLMCKRTNVQSLHVYDDGRYWFVMARINEG